MRFIPKGNIKASGQKMVRVRTSFGREVKNMFSFRSLLAGCFSIFFFFRLMYLGSDALTEWSISLKI